MAPDLGERTRRRQGKRRRRLVLAATAIGGLLVIGVIAGALALVTSEDEPSRKIADRQPTSSSSSSTSSTSTSSTSTTIVPKSTNSVVALAQQYDGYYEGTFTNTTFDTTGTVTLELRIDPNTGTLSITTTIDGDVFGGGAKEVRTITSQVQLGDPAAPVVTDTKAFGEVSARLDANLALILSAADVPDAKVKGFELVGTLRPDRSGFDATYTVAFENGDSAAGVITVLCATRGQRPSEVPTLCTPPA